MSGNARKLRDAVKTMLSTLQYNGEPAFVAVTDNTHDQFNGSPVVLVLPNDQTSVTGDNTHRDHTVSFSAIIQLSISSPTDVEQDKYNQMLDLSDLIQDAVEHGDFIDQLSTIDPTVPDFMMNVPSVTWHVAEGPIGALLLCNVVIEISYSKSVA